MSIQSDGHRVGKGARLRKVPVRYLASRRGVRKEWSGLSCPNLHEQTGLRPGAANIGPFLRGAALLVGRDDLGGFANDVGAEKDGTVEIVVESVVLGVKTPVKEPQRLVAWKRKEIRWWRCAVWVQARYWDGTGEVWDYIYSGRGRRCGLWGAFCLGFARGIVWCCATRF